LRQEHRFDFLIHSLPHNNPDGGMIYKSIEALALDMLVRWGGSNLNTSKMLVRWGVSRLNNGSMIYLTFYFLIPSLPHNGGSANQ